MSSKYYTNPYVENDRRTFMDFIRWRMGYFTDTHISPPPEGFVYPSGLRSYEKGKPSATWIGHSTFLVSNGVNILTDPIWDTHCSPLRFDALKRRNDPPFAISALPKIDVVLISHNHYDHLDESTVRTLFRLQPHILWILPKGLAKWFHARGITKCIELDWWETYKRKAFQITAVPTQHFSGRALWDRNKTLWNGYVVNQGEKKFYFVGDTGYNPYDFKEIGRRFGPMDLSLIPIGTYVPIEFMSPVHSSPYDAVQIHCDVGSKFSLGMHWNTFCLSEEPFDRPPYDLYLAMKKKNLPFDTFLPVNIGVRVNW